MKTILVTGASSGIGRALAVRASRAGYSVYAVGRNAAALDALATQITDEGNTIATDVTDVGDPANAPALIARAIGKLGHVDVLVNNAGAAAVGPIVAQSDGALREQFGTHVIGPLALVREALVSLRAAKGHVFMIGSGVARVPIAGMGAYPPSKAALRSATTILRRELAPLEIAVTYVDPGAVDTPFMERAGMPGAPASILISPELVARRIMVAIGTRPRVLNVAPLQTAAVALAELLPALTDAVLERNPNLLGTSPPTLGLRDRNGHVEPKMLTGTPEEEAETFDAEDEPEPPLEEAAVAEATVAEPVADAPVVDEPAAGAPAADTPAAEPPAEAGVAEPPPEPAVVPAAPEAAVAVEAPEHDPWEAAIGVVPEPALEEPALEEPEPVGEEPEAVDGAAEATPEADHAPEDAVADIAADDVAAAELPVDDLPVDEAVAVDESALAEPASDEERAASTLVAETVAEPADAPLVEELAEGPSPAAVAEPQPPEAPAVEAEAPAMRWTYEPPEADDALLLEPPTTPPAMLEPPTLPPLPERAPAAEVAVMETVAEDVQPPADEGPAVTHDDEPARTTSSFDAAIEPLRRRMERARLDPAFIRGLLVRDAELDVGDAAMRWAGMPNKNERALTGEIFFALAEWGFLTPRPDGRYRVIRSADEPAS